MVRVNGEKKCSEPVELVGLCILCKAPCEESCKILKLMGLASGLDFDAARKISNPVMDDDNIVDDDDERYSSCDVCCCEICGFDANRCKLLLYEMATARAKSGGNTPGPKDDRCNAPVVCC